MKKNRKIFNLNFSSFANNIKSFLVLFFLIITTEIFGQAFYGKILDKNNGENLAFVNIVYNSKNQGIATDIEGNFIIPDKSKIEFLKCSYIGYKTKIINSSELVKKNKITILLEPDEMLLSEIEVFPGENPAHRIINLVIENRDKNNPEKLSSFCYHSYNRMHFTIDYSRQKKRKWLLEQDSIKNIQKDSLNISQQDSLILSNKDIENDSTIINNDMNDSVYGNKKSITDLFNKQHLFLTEVITERKFQSPNNNKEVVLAQRMSGLKNPAFLLLTSQFQSMSFYKDYIEILNKKYLSPISKNSVRQYFFDIEDTMYNEKGDTIFIIFYRPYKGKNFEGVKGLLHINSNMYAIENITAEPAEKHPLFDVNIQQKFEFVDDKQWFPVQLNTNIVLNSLQVASDSIVAYR